MDSVPHKTCNKCKVTKPISEFGELASSKSRRAYRCKECVNEFLEAKRDKEKLYRQTSDNYEIYRRNYYEKTRETRLAQSRLWRAANPERCAELFERRRVRKFNNGVFYIRTKFMVSLYSSSCVVCGRLDNITADHVIPIKLGGTHSEGNLQPLCRRCNSSKGAKLMVEFRRSRPDLFASKNR